MKNERKEARWKGAGFGDYECTRCWEITQGTPALCPHCGAIMDNPERCTSDFPPDDPFENI